MSDADISRAAVATLKWKTLVPDERIKITVSSGITPGSSDRGGLGSALKWPGTSR